MLEIKGKIHDRYTLEFKVGYSRYSQSAAVNDFMMDTWIFVPDSLYINAKTYSKNDFYRDFRALTRLITPVYTLDEIANPRVLPLVRLYECCSNLVKDHTEDNEKAFEHQIKMFANIIRSALRAAVNELYCIEDAERFRSRLDGMVSVLGVILKSYREMPGRVGLDQLDYELRSRYGLGEEYLCRIIDMHLFRIMDYVRIRYAQDYAHIVASSAAFLDAELVYQREKKFLLPEDGKPEINRAFLYRTGQLKKYIESDLYILADKKSNVFFWQQVFFMLAAGLSMVFATIISFSFQQTYGNFTLPLFIALVVSYMFKDRIKDLMHYWFANKLGSKFYDYKIKLALRGEPVGWGKEGCDFVNEEKLPNEIRAQRGRVSELEAGHCALRETVIVYRRRVAILGKHLRRLSHFPLEGLNDIIRINLRDFLRRMDSPHVSVYINEEKGRFHTQQAEKVYYLHFVMRYRYQGITGYKRFRVGLTRRGIVDLMEW